MRRATGTTVTGLAVACCQRTKNRANRLPRPSTGIQPSLSVAGSTFSLCWAPFGRGVVSAAVSSLNKERRTCGQCHTEIARGGKEEEDDWHPLRVAKPSQPRSLEVRGERPTEGATTDPERVNQPSVSRNAHGCLLVNRRRPSFNGGVRDNEIIGRAALSRGRFGAAKVRR